MIRKLFISALLAGTGIAGLYAQTTQPTAPIKQPGTVQPQFPDKNNPDLIKEEPNLSSLKQVNIPDNVKKAFASAMPNASDVTWNTRDSYYEVEFTDNGIKKIRVYDSKADLHELGVQQDIKAIPADIKSYVKKNYSGETILIVYKGFEIGGGANVTTAKPGDNNMAMGTDNNMPGKTMDSKPMDNRTGGSALNMGFYRVTTTTHLLYFDSDGKFMREGYEGPVTSSKL